jgi:hypothetical protein
MSPISPNISAAANRLFERASEPRDASQARREPAVAAEHVLSALAAVLNRWFGPFGYHALITRSLAEAAMTHPALVKVRVRSELDPIVEGLADAAIVYGSDAVRNATVAVLTALIGLLSRLVGEDMALGVVEHSIPAIKPPADQPAREESTS